jgi:hypothetical protein
MGLKKVTIQCTDTQPHHIIVFGSVTLPKESSQLILMMYQIPANDGTYQKGFLASSHTTSTAQPGEQPSRHKKSHTAAAVFIHKRTVTVMGIRLQMLVIW